MNITREDTGNLSAVLTVELNPADYLGKVEKTLKDYQRKANIPGFRPGKVPFGMIKKMYGPATTADELNKTVSDTLNNYITENKLELLGSPLAIVDEPLDLNMETPGDVKFKFEIGFQPAIEVALNSDMTVDYYNILISDEMVDRYVADIRKRNGSQVSTDVAEATDRLVGTFTELENGEPKAEGITKEASLLIETVKDEQIKEQMVGVTVGAKIVFDPLKAFANAVEVGAMLGIPTTEAEQLTSEFSFEVTDITRQVDAEMNEAFYGQLYPADQLKTEEEFRERIRQDASQSFVQESDKVFMDKAIKQLIEKAGMELPHDFLKKWIADSNQGKITPEQIEAEYDQYVTSVKWQLIENEILRQHEIRVTENEIRDYYRSMFRFSEEMDEDTKMRIEQIVDSFMKNREEVRKINDQLHDKKLLELFKSVVTLNKMDVSYEEFIKLASETK